MSEPAAGLRVLIVAADSLARAGLAALVACQPGYYVAGQTASGERLPEEVNTYRADVVVWDLGFDPEGPLEELETLRDSHAPIIVLAAGQATAESALARGVRGVLSRDVEGRRLRAALQASVAGLTVVDAIFAEGLPSRRSAVPEQPAEPLTPREVEVLQLLALGIANKSIASQLGISEHTVKFHVNSILSKLGAQSRTEAVTRGTRLGLIKL